MYDITIDNICDSCFTNEDECGEYRECCYEGYLRKQIKVVTAKDINNSMKGKVFLMEIDET